MNPPIPKMEDFKAIKTKWNSKSICKGPIRDKPKGLGIEDALWKQENGKPEKALVKHLGLETDRFSAWAGVCL